MKYLFITLEIQEGERRYLHRSLHKTKGNDIHFASERYAASFWNHSKHDKNGWWWPSGEMALRVHNVTQLKEKDYRLIESAFDGTYKL